MDTMLVVWLLAAVVFLAVEAVTAAMCSIWCVAGALAALLAAALGAAVWLQVVLFVVVTGLCFWFLYPKLKHLVNRRRQPTNADMVIGRTCIVTQTIDNLAGTGAVSVGGKIWSARTESGFRVDEGELVRVQAIEGVKLIVTPVQAASAVL